MKTLVIDCGTGKAELREMTAEEHNKYEAAQAADLARREADVSGRRRETYEEQGITLEAMVVALWEERVEGRPEALNALQAKRQAVKSAVPKLGDKRD